MLVQAGAAGRGTRGGVEAAHVADEQRRGAYVEDASWSYGGLWTYKGSNSIIRVSSSIEVFYK